MGAAYTNGPTKDEEDILYYLKPYLNVDFFFFEVYPDRIVPAGINQFGTGTFLVLWGDYCAAHVIYGKNMDYLKEQKCEPYNN